MDAVRKLKEQHEFLKNANVESEEFLQKLTEHFELEEKVLEERANALGGNDELSPVGMVKMEHKLLLEYLKSGNLEGFKNLFRYHLIKEETQIYPLLG